MLNQLYLTIIFLLCIFPNWANDFYSKFHQNDYKIEFQRLELIGNNKSVYGNYGLWKLKRLNINRSRAVMNMTMNLKVNLRTGMEMAVPFYKFLSNQYRKLPGTNFLVNCSKSLNTNIIGLQIFFKYGNFTTCEIIQETIYVACYIYPDESRYPPHIFPVLNSN